jgi:DNA-binding NtrC family response regulator
MGRSAILIAAEGSAVRGVLEKELSMSVAVRQLMGPSDVAGGSDLVELIGDSAAMHLIRRQIPPIAALERTTLITGPTGSGKDVVARALHAASARSGRAFVAVHCAALPESLIEAELFGHSRGAFTGATQARAGLIRSASSGTLFLDEIDSLSLASQAKLLRFLETGEYRTVGSDAVEQSSAWVLAASNQDLRQRVRAGLFREDLLYRLEVLRVAVPPLAERPEDILPLARHFLARGPGGARTLATGAERALLAHGWPGNVRELRHRVEAAALLCGGSELEASQLWLAASEPRAARGEAAPESSSLEQALWDLVDRRGLTLEQSIAVCERALVEAALRAEHNCRTRAAERLGIHVRTIYKKLVALGELAPRLAASVHGS